MAATLLKLIALAGVLASAETTWSENLVLADCGIGLGENGGSTSREMMYYSGEAWGAPTYMSNVPWDGSYPWRGSGVTQTLPNGDTWTVLINNAVGDPNLAGWAVHTYDSNVLPCWSRHLDGLYRLDDGKWCSMAYICNHAPFTSPDPAPAPDPSPVPKPPPAPGPLGENATPGALKYQPVIDFDNSACYNTAAITSDGHCNDGLEIGHGNCRQMDRLYNSNTYVREKCTDDGWCFYLYGYYFEKDEGGALAHGHKHDWEHLAVWTLHNEAKYLAWSAHGNYKVNKPDTVEWQGQNPKFVVERDMATTHAFRRAEGNEPAENASGGWYRSPLVSVERMDRALKERMLTHNWGSAHPDLTDERFEKAYQSTWELAKDLDNVRPPRPDPIPPPHREL
ncbi:hypothetical protein S40285_09036 [Stachybotrys chlorohalonatus IBT 40285]|uniref:Uncharacterized protein n=1 Tax=Stachybotrys chlorohalonatus (strain IBT 40285) TaxID=1283841 RepID=A0A084QV58_STAC4|nr:hypothetical protein S40285_09036 [Stachybotrys chlorohalonata IBT 40285]